MLVSRQSAPDSDSPAATLPPTTIAAPVSLGTAVGLLVSAATLFLPQDNGWRQVLVVISPVLSGGITALYYHDQQRRARNRAEQQHAAEERERRLIERSESERLRRLSRDYSVPEERRAEYQRQWEEFELSINRREIKRLRVLERNSERGSMDAQ